MRILFLDDNLLRHKKFKQNSIGFVSDQAYTAQQAIRFLENNTYDLIMLDHDLDYHNQNLILANEEDGRFVAKWMAEDGSHIDTPVVVHSLNVTGGEMMVDILIQSGFKEVNYIPFAWLMISKHDDGRILVDKDKRPGIDDYQ